MMHLAPEVLRSLHRLYSAEEVGKKAAPQMSHQPRLQLCRCMVRPAAAVISSGLHTGN